MKRYIAIFVVFCAVSLSASAQVEKSVEVTKNYAPEIGVVRKMDITPNMIDTITLRPEIDYSVTPRSFASTMSTHHFNPATITYWEYERQYPFYLKLGVGYPLNTIGDLYASAHRADVGYVTGYINHHGQYHRFKGYDNRATQTENRLGVMGGKYFGRYTLSGDLHYDLNSFNRFPLNSDYDRRSIEYNDVKLAVNFGDSFADYNHINFKVYGSANLYTDTSKNFVKDDRYQQINATAGVVLAREITKRGALSLNVDYEGYYGLKSLGSYKNSIVGATLLCRYRSGSLLDINAGVKLYYDHNSAYSGKKDKWHGFPVVNVSLNISDKGSAVPYVEVDGELRNNSYYSLVQRNPYVAILGSGNGLLQNNVALPNTDIYNVRFGISGHSANSKFAYRLYANMSFILNDIYWYNVNEIFFDAVTADRNVWSLCGSVDYKPISQLLITAQVKGSLYDESGYEGLDLSGSLPDIEAMLRLRYSHKKFTLGMTAELYGRTRWLSVYNEKLFNESAESDVKYASFIAPTSLNLSLYGDWHINKTCTVFVEGNNLLGDVKGLTTYRWAFYREMGASFTVGVKVQF